MTVIFKPISEHPTIQTIRRSVSKLNTPALEPLLGVFLDVKQSVAAEQNTLRQKIEETRQEGWEAAARLMAPTQKQLSTQRQSYFDAIEQKRRDKNTR